MAKPKPPYIMMRPGTFFKPTLSNITGKVTDVELTGRSAHLFKAELVNGNIVVTVKGDNKAEQNALNT